MNYLVKLGLSPVQGFLAQAGRTRDLVNGSAILVRSIRAARVQFETVGKVQIPTKASDHHPNYFVGTIDAESKGVLRAILRDCELKARAAWSEILAPPDPAGQPNFQALQETWFTQLFDIRWVALPFDSAAPAAGDFDAIDGLFEARKLIHAFPPLPQAIDRTSNKCSQCGERPQASENWDTIWRKNILFRQRERLCVVCLAKRRMQPSSRVMTASDLASSSYQNKIEDLPPADKERINRAWDDLRGKVNEGPRLSSPASWKEASVLLYPGGLVDCFPEILTANGIDIREGYVGLREAHRTFRETVGETLGSPPEYYAVLALDGDRMGQWISGRQPGTAQKSPCHRQMLSEALLEIAQQWARTIRDRGGQLVYAGGDDLLALLPGDAALSITREIQQQFRGVMESAGWPQITVSGGLVFNHFRQPLRHALKEVRELTDVAKNETGRDALALSVLLPSGARYRFSWKWTLLPALSCLDFCLALASSVSSGGSLSPRFLYDLAQIVPDCFHSETDSGTRADMVERLVKRLHGRHSRPRGSSAPPQMIDGFRALAVGSGLDTSIGKLAGNLIDLLRGTAVLAREGVHDATP